MTPNADWFRLYDLARMGGCSIAGAFLLVR